MLANEWAAKGGNAHVNAIAPGYVATNNTVALREDPARNAAILERIPAGRWGDPADIGGPDAFPCSEAALHPGCGAQFGWRLACPLNVSPDERPHRIMALSTSGSAPFSGRMGRSTPWRTIAVSGGDWGRHLGFAAIAAHARRAHAEGRRPYRAGTRAQERGGPPVKVGREEMAARENRGAVLALMADLATWIVILTVTEKGCCHEPAIGAPDLVPPDIAHEIAEPLPISAPGFLVRAFAMRRGAACTPKKPGDPTPRFADRDGWQPELPPRILGTLVEVFAAGRAMPGLVLAVAAWMRSVRGVDEAGAQIEVKSPLAGRLRALSDGADRTTETVSALLVAGEVFPRDLAALRCSPGRWPRPMNAFSPLVHGQQWRR